MTFGTVAITPGAGADMGVDNVSGSKLQRIKVDVGAEGLSVPLVGFNGVPSPSDYGIPVRPIGQDTISASFTGVASSLISPYMTPLSLRTMTVAQSNGNLVVTATTTANAEFLARSNTPVAGAWQAKFQNILSQRIAQNNFAVILGDLIDTGLTVTWTATVLTVNKVAHGFTAANIGQGMFVSFPTVTSGVALPGRYVIASIVNADSYTLTVAGFTTGGGTATLFGRTHVKVLYNGTTATAAAFDAQREGWNSGDTTLTTLTSASPGHMMLLNSDARQLTVQDMLVASGTALNSTLRGFRVVNLPADDTPLYLFLWAYNGSTNPASGTTWTVGFWSLEDFSATPVHIAGNRLQGAAAPMPVTQIGTGVVSISGTPAVDTELQAAATVTDAHANPNTSMIGAVQMQYNGTSWDRVRTNWNVALGDATTKTVTVNGATQTNFSSRAVHVAWVVGTPTGSSPTMVIKLQWSPDGGTTWIDIPGATTASITAGGTYALSVAPGCTPVANSLVDFPMPRTWRAVYTMGGTTPSFAMTVAQASYVN